MILYGQMIEKLGRSISTVIQLNGLSLGDILP